MKTPDENNTIGYHEFIGEDNETFGSFEIMNIENDTCESIGGDWLGQSGFYWWACFPGCMPDGALFGPFETGQLAWLDAQEY